MSTKKLTQKEYLLRALRTFLQAAIGYFIANLTATLLGSEDMSISTVLVGVGTSALAAGLAAVMNLRGNVQTETEDPVSDTSSSMSSISEVPAEGEAAATDALTAEVHTDVERGNMENGGEQGSA